MWKAFDEADWYGFAGEKFVDSDPIINYDLKVDGLDAVAIFDLNGLGIETITAEGEPVSMFTLPLGAEALLFLTQTTTEWTMGELEDIGFHWERFE